MVRPDLSCVCVAPGSRVPSSRMFYTLVRNILRRTDLDAIDRPAKTTERSTEEVVEAVIRRRLCKIESLQAHFVRELATKLRTRKAAVANIQEGSSPTVVRLSSQQQLLIGK